MLEAMAFKIPESVLVVVHTPDRQILLLERRELLEETGLAVGTLTDWRLRNRYEIWPQWRARYAPDVTHNVEHVFGFLVSEATVAILDRTEHTAQLWLPWQDAMKKVFSPTNRDAIWQLQKRIAA